MGEIKKRISKMIKQNVVYCKPCTVLRVGTINLECNLCKTKMKDLGYIETVEDAIWLGMQYKGSAVEPSLEWHSQDLLNPGREITW
jgi:hypothetical protein